MCVNLKLGGEMDPLYLLRDFTIQGELDQIVRHGGDYRFSGDISFPAAAKTSFRSKQGNLYTLETLIFFIKNHHLKHTDYLQLARLHRSPAVTLPDRRPLTDFLHGRLLSSDSIELPPANPNPLPPHHYHPEIPSAVAGAIPAEEDAAAVMERIRGGEKRLRSREEVLQCGNRDLHGVMVSSVRRAEERQRAEVQQRRKDGGGGGGELEGTPRRAVVKAGRVVGEGVPIILVPSAFQTLITIYNVKEFLEDGVFVETGVKVREGKGGRPECVTVQKKVSRDRGVAAYEVRDKPSALKSDDWDRVVAVFVLGKEWQFKDWPFKDHVEIFNKIIGFFMRFEDDSVESAKTVMQWNVKIISISKNKRHRDRAAALEVWDMLEEFMRSRSRS